MVKAVFTIILVVFILPPSFLVGPVLAQSNQSVDSFNNHTVREEQEGKEIWVKLQAKEVTCDTLSDGDSGALGEYYMGQMTGDFHEAMNTMMERMMGKVGEEQMHVVMGKRLSDCDTSAQIPQNGVGFMPMMWMMGGGNPMMGYGGWNNMMGGWSGFGIFGWLSMILFWALIILGIVALIRYLGRSGPNREDKKPLEILKERYAKGEIDKKEFEAKKRDLV